MTNAKVISTYQDDDIANLSAAVNEGAGIGIVEYIVSIPAKDENGEPKSSEQIEAQLIAALKEKRAAQIDSSASVIPELAEKIIQL